MAAPDPTAPLRVPGRLAADCTDLTLAWPHGGTGLGTVGQIHLLPARDWDVVTEESFGRRVEAVVDLGEAWILGALLRGYDSDALAAVFASTATGAVSGKKIVDAPGTTGRAGSIRTPRVVVFTPDDPAHRWFVAYAASLLVDRSAKLGLGIDREVGIPVLFLCGIDGSSRAVKWGFVEDLSL